MLADNWAVYIGCLLMNDMLMIIRYERYINERSVDDQPWRLVGKACTLCSVCSEKLSDS